MIKKNLLAFYAVACLASASFSGSYDKQFKAFYDSTKTIFESAKSGKRWTFSEFNKVNRLCNENIELADVTSVIEIKGNKLIPKYYYEDLSTFCINTSDSVMSRMNYLKDNAVKALSVMSIAKYDSVSSVVNKSIGIIKDSLARYDFDAFGSSEEKAKITTTLSSLEKAASSVSDAYNIVGKSFISCLDKIKAVLSEKPSLQDGTEKLRKIKADIEMLAKVSDKDNPYAVLFKDEIRKYLSNYDKDVINVFSASAAVKKDTLESKVAVSATPASAKDDFYSRMDKDLQSLPEDVDSALVEKVKAMPPKEKKSHAPPARVVSPAAQSPAASNSYDSASVKKAEAVIPAKEEKAVAPKSSEIAQPVPVAPVKIDSVSKPVQSVTPNKNISKPVQPAPVVSVKKESVSKPVPSVSSTAKKASLVPFDFAVSSAENPFAGTLGRVDWERAAAYMIRSCSASGAWKPVREVDFFFDVPGMIKKNFLAIRDSGFVLTESALEKIAERYSARK